MPRFWTESSPCVYVHAPPRNKLLQGTCGAPVCRARRTHSPPRLEGEVSRRGTAIRSDFSATLSSLAARARSRPRAPCGLVA
eukprot:1648602-Prymnesium_polylepis.1